MVDKIRAACFRFRFSKLEDFQQKCRRFVRLWKSHVIIKQYVHDFATWLGPIISGIWSNKAEVKFFFYANSKKWKLFMLAKGPLKLLKISALLISGVQYWKCKTKTSNFKDLWGFSWKTVFWDSHTEHFNYFRFLRIIR